MGVRPRRSGHGNRGARVAIATCAACTTALVLELAGCSAFDGASEPAPPPADGAVEAPGPGVTPPDGAGGVDGAPPPPDECTPPVATLSKDDKSGAGFCFEADTLGDTTARLYPANNGQINGENVNGCVRAVFSAPLMNVEVSADFLTQACGHLACPGCTNVQIRSYAVIEPAYVSLGVSTITSETTIGLRALTPTNTFVICRTNAPGGVAEIREVRGTCP